MLDLDKIARGHHRPLHRSEFEELARMGAFTDERVELLYGILVTMSPIGGRHVEVVKRLAKRLIVALGDRADVLVQSSFAASDDSEPQPDLLITRPGDFSTGLPSSAWLVIEVAESSLEHDRDIKSELYATSGVPEYWVVDLVNDEVIVLRAPVAGRYGEVARHGRGATLAVPSFADVQLSVDEILPAR